MPMDGALIWWWSYDINHTVPAVGAGFRQGQFGLDFIVLTLNAGVN